MNSLFIFSAQLVLSDGFRLQFGYRGENAFVTFALDGETLTSTQTHNKWS